MDVQVQPLDKGLRSVKRASAPGDQGKGHRWVLTNSLSPMTFIAAPFISACKDFTPQTKRPRGWQGVTPNTRRFVPAPEKKLKCEGEQLKNLKYSMGIKNPGPDTEIGCSIKINLLNKYQKL